MGCRLHGRWGIVQIARARPVETKNVRLEANPVESKRQRHELRFYAARHK